MLIGREIEVLASRDISMLKLRGMVIDETKNLIVVLTPEERQIKIPKRIVTLGIYDSRKGIMTIEGSKIVGTPADRIKG